MCPTSKKPRTPVHLLPRLLAPMMLALASLSVQAGELQDFSATYMIEKYDNIIGVADYTLEQDAGKAHFSMRTQLSGLAALFRDDKVEEDSWLEPSQGKLQLVRYQYRHIGSKHNRNTDLAITWAKDCSHGLASGSHAGKPVSLEVKRNVLDTLSFQLALMQDAAATDTDLTYTVFNKDELKSYSFTRKGHDTLRLANRDVATIIVERKSDDRITRLWLATQFQYIPVKIEQIENDITNTRMVIDKLAQAGQKQF